MYWTWWEITTLSVIPSCCFWEGGEMESLFSPVLPVFSSVTYTSLYIRGYSLFSGG